jgi:hypothetical protein
MNPLQWLKAIYETFGTPYPRASLMAVAILGAIFFAAVWLFAAKQVEKDRGASTQVVPATASGPASTKGPNSPAVTGSGNDVRYDQSSHAAKKPEPPK